MCMECRQYPCHPRCPNAPDPETVYTCAQCGEPIVEGDEYVEHDGDYYHADDCFYDAKMKIAQSEGATHRIASKRAKGKRKIGVCACCNEAIMSDENSYTFDGKMYHEECFEDNATDFLEDVISTGTAEAEEYCPEYDPYDD